MLLNMSTNYYLKRIPTQEEINNCKSCLEAGRLEDNSSCWQSNFEIGKDDSVQYWLDKMTTKIHIGKSASGWKFLFRTHEDIYNSNLSSVFQFLGEQISSGLWKLIDEYGSDVDLIKFKELVKDTMKTGIDINEYWKKYPERNTGWGGGPEQYTSFDGSRWWNTDFF